MRTWGGFLLELLLAVLYFVAGVIIVSAPAGSALALTLVIAAYLLVGGIFRVVAAFSLRFRGSGWLAFSGVVAFILGLAVWQNWPATGLWFIGLCVGVELIVQGVSWIALGLTASLGAAARAAGRAGHGPEASGAKQAAIAIRTGRACRPAAVQYLYR